MGFPLNKAFIGLWILLWILATSGCLSYRVLREVEGSPVAAPSETLRIGSTTLQDVLTLYGAPSRIVPLEGRDLFMYTQSVYVQNSIAFGIPLTDFAGSSVSFSGYTNLTRYDLLAMVFTPEGILEDMVFEKGSGLPYLETLFKDDSGKKAAPVP